MPYLCTIDLMKFIRLLVLSQPKLIDALESYGSTVVYYTQTWCTI